MKARSAPVETAIVRRLEVWPRCTCMVCIGLDLRYPDEGYQLAFWRYEPVTRGPSRGDVHILGPARVRRLARHED